MKHYGYQLENEIFWGGLTNGWEKVSMQLWISLCSNSRIILDVGANTGVYSLVAKTINPCSTVYAFEPVERIFSKLLLNNILNRYDIRGECLALSNYNGTATIYDTYTDHLYSVTINKNLLSKATPVIERKISTITLDHFIKSKKIEGVDLIKIDVETHEPEVLEGFSHYLKLYRPTLLIEILNDEVGGRVEDLIRNLDYIYFNIDERRGVRQVSHITKSDYFNYLLCRKEVAEQIGLIPSQANLKNFIKQL